MDYYDPNADWSLIPDYMREPVRRYVMHGHPVGDFLTAVFSGESLIRVVERADENNEAALVGWARFVYRYTPGNCQGSLAKHRAWMAAGGVKGLEQARAKA